MGSSRGKGVRHKVLELLTKPGPSVVLDPRLSCSLHLEDRMFSDGHWLLNPPPKMDEGTRPVTPGVLLSSLDGAALEAGGGAGHGGQGSCATASQVARVELERQRKLHNRRDAIARAAQAEKEWSRRFQSSKGTAGPSGGYSHHGIPAKDAHLHRDAAVLRYQKQTRSGQGFQLEQTIIRRAEERAFQDRVEATMNPDALRQAACDTAKRLRSPEKGHSVAAHPSKGTTLRGVSVEENRDILLPSLTSCHHPLETFFDLLDSGKISEEDVEELQRAARRELWQLGEAIHGEEPEETPRLEGIRAILLEKRELLEDLSNPLLLDEMREDLEHFLSREPSGPFLLSTSGRQDATVQGSVQRLSFSEETSSSTKTA